MTINAAAVGGGFLKAFNRILVVIKQTPYESYSQLKAQGKAPVALRWQRLQNRYELHRKCVADVTKVISNLGIDYVQVGREELHRGLILDKDLVIAVGGDGTVLNTSSFLDGSVPVLGVNSDPTRMEDSKPSHKKDERRSRGALCAISTNNLNEYLPRILLGDISPGLRTRIQCLVRSTYTETRLPPALNDILISHPIPAAVSRYRLHLCSGTLVHQPYTTNPEENELFSFNAWSSGIWVSTATGSTGAMKSAGGTPMDPHSRYLQYMVREHLIEDGQNEHLKFAGHSIIRPNEYLKIGWNSQHGHAYVDGQHFKHELELGDELRIDGNGPYLKIYDAINPFLCD